MDKLLRTCMLLCEWISRDEDCLQFKLTRVRVTTILKGMLMMWEDENYQ